MTEIFEARKPKDPAVMAEIDGTVDFGDRKRGKMTIIVARRLGHRGRAPVPRASTYRVHKGDEVRPASRWSTARWYPEDILRISGEEALCRST